MALLWFLLYLSNAVLDDNRLLEEFCLQLLVLQLYVFLWQVKLYLLVLLGGVFAFE